ncbi:hypothetical protein U1E44_04345 [Arenibacter sp. GZD96]|uniref:hypothetical protein n=1 Tax=Aurantibrevibacter litoralis TaxID=3106030 RepID=UPI002AFF5808|nr:hypothetical protein [Arenibacter sp. GZD-96]MEA1785311.1 hypothetical protein [Arenibacter sp. GZD-96]
MKFILRSVSWKTLMVLSVSTLIPLIILSFYGLYTHKFYFFKFDNYIFPLLTSIHFVYLYVMQFKIREQEPSDPQMRNLEYALYIIFIIYVFKGVDALMILLSYQDFESHLIPITFIPMGLLVVTLHFVLLVLTLLSFAFRKAFVGAYSFENNNQAIDPWE